VIGDRLGWSGPVVGVLAATVLAITARRYRSNVVMLTAAAAPVLGAVTGLAVTTAPAQLWWSIPALAVMATEAASRVAAVTLARFDPRLVRWLVSMVSLGGSAADMIAGHPSTRSLNLT